MTEVQKWPDKQSIPKNNPELLPIHPEIQTVYLRNLSDISQKWEDKFKQEVTFTSPDGRKYWKLEWEKRLLDYNADFWVEEQNKVITQFLDTFPKTEQDAFIAILNSDKIRWNPSLTYFWKYVRVESLLLAWDKHLQMKKERAAK